ncbi:hypothetical protein SmedWSM1115_10860 [Sinorhizobium medicae WSM1115]|uniref:hypothetical protein n=1 Tax=Sinorhizobium medicae TaxID=110321 RepID=UPI0003656EB5|nr:hypothetical protein [Sinorhizobium medicae]RVI57156.1 hypothetical protein CN192_11670 [Sinorhizobium medicae]UFX00314.1 hypothetical protein SmedWSM1115_10860 [Sinorhizobium medicae WSM1115]
MNVHRIETFGPHWSRFLRRDHQGRIASYPDDARRANAAHAIRHDRKLKHLVALGDLEAARLRLCDLDIYVSPALVVELIEVRQ